MEVRFFHRGRFDAFVCSVYAKPVGWLVARFGPFRTANWLLLIGVVLCIPTGGWILVVPAVWTGALFVEILALKVAVIQARGCPPDMIPMGVVRALNRVASFRRYAFILLAEAFYFSITFTGSLRAAYGSECLGWLFIIAGGCAATCITPRRPARERQRAPLRARLQLARVR